ncbi:MAG: cytochrome P450, partial [Halioglobus sp.]|nr:cytochrome P450 [Halioglobus sp.]
MSILGLPRESEATMLKLTQEIFGPLDPDLQRDPAENDAQMGTLMELGQYFTEIVEDRRKNPTDDLATVLANAEVDGKPMDPLDQMSYFIIAATAGHDTTSAVLGAGMKALLDQPEQ